MQCLKHIKGLKYPDDYFIKFFFKKKLHTRVNLKFLEFGCGNGNNLILPFIYGNANTVIGIDYDKILIEYAKYNFNLLANEQNGHYIFYADDMSYFAALNRLINADVLSLPNIVNYLPREVYFEFLKNCKNNRLYKKGANFFIRYRTPRDFRYGLGKRVGYNCYKIDENNDITGEKGAINCFYTEHEMLDLLKEYIGLMDYHLFHIDFENIAANGDTILNSDIVIWGKIH